VKTVIDVRLRPDKASLGSYAKSREPDKGIAGLLAKAGIGYLSLPELGNLFLEYDDWQTRYRSSWRRPGHSCSTDSHRRSADRSACCAPRRRSHSATAATSRSTWRKNAGGHSRTSSDWQRR